MHEPHHPIASSRKKPQLSVLLLRGRARICRTTAVLLLLLLLLPLFQRSLVEYRQVPPALELVQHRFHGAALLRHEHRLIALLGRSHAGRRLCRRPRATRRQSSTRGLAMSLLAPQQQPAQIDLQDRRRRRVVEVARHQNIKIKQYKYEIYSTVQYSTVRVPHQNINYIYNFTSLDTRHTSPTSPDTPEPT